MNKVTACGHIFSPTVTSRKKLTVGAPLIGKICYCWRIGGAPTLRQQ
jgi:hypothetical protein